MKIDKIEVFVLRAPYEESYWGTHYVMEEQTEMFFRDYSAAYPLMVRSKPLYEPALQTVLVKITTDDGVVGWGESKGVVAPRAAKAILEDMVIPCVIDMNPLDIALIKERMAGLMRLRGHVQGFHQEATSGIEIALWDIKGKVAGLPVYSLLGGAFRDRIPVYASGIAGLDPGYTSVDVEQLQNEVRRALDRGFQALKLCIGKGVETDLASFDAAREVVGQSNRILVDAGGRYDYHAALRLAKELEKRNAFWLETPLPVDDFQGYIQLSLATSIPIANDMIWTTGMICEMYRQGAKVIFIPEVLKAGGILECKQIADLADRFHMPYAPHVSQGSMLQFVATAHLCAAVPNFLISEYWWQDNPLGNHILNRPLVLQDGHLIVPQEPGLGVEVNEAAIREFLVE